MHQGNKTRSAAAQALAEMAAETEELRQPGGGTVADALAEWLATRYVLAARDLASQSEGGGMDLPALSRLTSDVLALRKGDHGAERLRMDRERLEILRERNRETMEARFAEWLRQPGMADRICGPKLTPEEKEARMRAIFGLGKSVSRGLSAEAIAEIEAAARLL